MTTEHHRRLLSGYLDGDVTETERREVERLLAHSEEAQRYLDRLRAFGEEMRSRPAPDLTARIIAAVTPAARPRRRLAAAFAAGAVAGAVFIGLAVRQPAPVAGADLPDQVLAAQSRVDSLTARLQVVERGWHPDVAERTYRGSLVYRAPETLWVRLVDDTVYPSPDWVPNHLTLVVDEARAWSTSTPACPTEALPGCTPNEPRVRVVTDREPFPDRSPAPLDLIVPAVGFARSGPPVLLGVATIDGRSAVGVEVSVAQVASLLDGLIGTGNWREVHPTDRVELWLDTEALVPLSLTVYPADTEDRSLWAVHHGYTDRPGLAVLEVTWSDLAINQAVTVEAPAPSSATETVSAGFTDLVPDDLAALTPAGLPESMALHRTGVIATEKGPVVSVATWSDGRAWLKLSRTEKWTGDRLFGDLGALVRRVDLATGVVYLNERGDRVAVHGDGSDAVLEGSLPTETLLLLAAGLPVTGREVPTRWAEAATAGIEEARAEIQGLLLPAGLTGFAPPAIRVEEGTVVLAYPGPGNRGFLLTETAEGRLPPPLDADVRGVTVRGRPGRYSPGRGLLEWVEDDLTIGLSSTTLTLSELLAVAESLERG